MDFGKYLKAEAKKIDEEVEKLLNKWQDEVRQVSPELVPLSAKFAESCYGGKRIRGVLCKIGFELTGGAGEEIYKIGAAIEILHTALLIHDDIIDQSPTRRGKPSLFQALGGGHDGESLAIVLGDIGLYLPIKIIAESNFPDQFKLKAVKYLSEIIINTGWGQILDVKQPHTDLMLLYKLKTADYTISAPLILGSLLGGGEDKLIRNLGEFGENVGIAFQIQDNILDGETEVDYGRLSALEYMSKAKKIIPKITKNEIIRKLLAEMCEYLVDRRK